MKYVKSIAMVAMLASTVAMAVPTTNTLHIGVVDLDQILHQSTQVKTMNAALEKKFTTEHAALVTEQKQLTQKIQDFQRNASVMSKDKKTNLSKTLHAQETALSQKQMAFSKKVMSAQRNMSNQLLTKLRSIVSTVAKQKHFDVVVAKQAVLYVNKDFEITNQVSEKFE